MYDLAYVFDGNNSKSFEEALAKFKSIITKNVDIFKVYIGLIGSVSDLEKFSATFNLKLYSKEELITISLDSSIANSNMYAYFQIETFDYRSAIRRAGDELNKFFDLLDFYLQTSIPKVDRFAVCISDHSERGWKSVPIEESSPTIAPDLEQQLIQTISLVNNEIISKETNIRLKGLIQYINLSRKAHSKEISFLNAWVALESFTKLEGDTIKNIKEFVSPIICIKYPYKLLKNFIEDCKRVGIKEFRKIDVWDLLSILKNTDSKEYDKLVIFCNCYELLANRLTKLKNIFMNGKNLVETIENHKQRIEWHLQRLYRIRNAIVHSADSPFGLDRCLKHLNEYVWIIFSEVVFRLTSKPTLTIEDALVMLKDLYDSTIDELRYLDDYDVSILKEGPLLV